VIEVTLAELTLAAILSVVKPPTVDAEVERPRLEQMAQAIVAAVDERDYLHAWLRAAAPLPFTGPEARAGAALALVAIAFHESGFSARVSDCRRVGAFERSLTAFQLHGRFARGPYSEAEVCASPRLAAERALWVLALHGSRCATPQHWFYGYASGSCGVQSGAGRRQCAIWEQLVRAAGLKASCDMPRVERHVERHGR
jgi:hypothetical protein